MKQEELKEIALSMLQYLQENISTQNKSATLSEVIEHINNSDTIFDDIISSTSSLEKTLEDLKVRYRDIAFEGIDSYKSTNEQFKKLADQHKEQMDQISENPEQINLDIIKEKFADIQEHMFKEVEKANQKIAKLTEKITLLEETSNVDPLTKVFNRRALQSYLSKVCSKGSLKQELHLLMVDIDNFKTINDQYGHIAGDKILIFIANMLTRMLRDWDKVFRYGGEEFVIILNRIDDAHCQMVAKRILDQISANKLVYKNTTIKVTVSIGAAKYQAGDTPESIIERADKALYKAKNSGKNKLVLSSSLK